MGRDKRSRSPRGGRRSRSRDRGGARREDSSDRRRGRRETQPPGSSTTAPSAHSQSTSVAKNKFEEVDIAAILSGGMHSTAANTGSYHNDGAANGSKPADVESFVPAIPKSLLQLVVSPAGPGGALALLGPTLTAETTKMVREARRVHVTGFTHGASKQDIVSYFATIVQDVRRLMFEREIVLHEAPKDPHAPKLSDTALIDIDQVIDICLDAAKSKPFAFVELTNSDVVTEMIQQCQEDKDRFVFNCARDGTSNPLLFRRPKDYTPSRYTDPFKVALQGISPLISDARLRETLESFGDIAQFERNDKYVYIEFTDVENAKECTEDLHGRVLQGRAVFAKLVDEPMKGILMQSGIHVGDVKTDPREGGDGGLPDFLRDKSHDHVREVLEFITTLNQAALNLQDLHPHLAPQFGTNIPVFPTRILVLLNAVEEADVLLDEDYSKVLQDLSAELEKHGRVKRLIVPRRVTAPPPPKPLQPKKFEPKASSRREVSVLPLQNPFASEGGNPASAATPTSTSSSNPAPQEDEYAVFLREKEEEELKFQMEKEEYHKAREAWKNNIQHPVHGGIGRVFAEYETVDEAKDAQAAISGRLFRHRAIVTSFLFEDVLYPPVEADAEDDARRAEEAVNDYLDRTTGVQGDGAVAQEPNAQDEECGAGDID